MSVVESKDDVRVAQAPVPFSRVSVIHTLGPEGTNLERAAHEWFRRQNRRGRVVLHSRIEHALDHIDVERFQAILACAAYPAFHNLVFSNLERLQIADSFVFPTYEMLLAVRAGFEDTICSVAAHTATESLARQFGEPVHVDSNAKAAVECARGVTDACITTRAAAELNHLIELVNFGPVPMAFTLHLGIDASLLPDGVKPNIHEHLLLNTTDRLQVI